jgi:hypothetical protein
MSSVRSRILSNIVESIKPIIGTGEGYVRDVRLVRLPALAPPFRPIAEIWTGLEKKEEDQSFATFCSLEVSVNVHASTRGNIESEASTFISSVERALLADKYRGGLAFDTIAVENEIIADDLSKPEYTVSMLFIVNYPHAIGDPNTQ